MRYSNRIALWLAFSACCPAQEAAFHLYNGRDVVGHARLNLADPMLDPLLPLLHSPLGIQFGALLGSDRSLLLSDCDSGSQWCANPEFSFPKVFARAAHSLKLPAGDLVRSWWLSAIQDPGFRGDLYPWDGTIDQVPLQPLAIVNRIDLARWNNQWNEAELRFVYGIAPKSDGTFRKSTLILEFVLPSKSWQQFQTLAGKWRDVGNATGAAFPIALSAALDESGYAASRYVRIRTNVDENGPWQLAEWDLTPSLKPDPRKALPNSLMVEQFKDDYMQANPGSIMYNAFTAALWKDVGSEPGPKHINIPPSYLETRPKSYKAAVYGSLNAPKNFCATDPTRNVLALQRCTGCHETEKTSTSGSFGFTHIANRAAGQSSRLSAFLVGTSPDAPLTLEQIYYGKGTFDVDVPYTNYTLGADGHCSKPVNATAHRKYYDLGRRRLFLAAVLTAQPTPNPDDIKKIQEFHTDYSH